MENEWICESPDRLDVVLVQGLPDLSRARSQKLIKGGKVTINGKRVTKASHPVQEGDEVRVRIEAVPVTDGRIEPTDLHLAVLYEDEWCMVIDKTAGYAVHPAPSTGDEVTILHGVAQLFAMRNIPFSSDGVLVHRLDRETTGCLLVAKDVSSHVKLQKQFEERTVKKFYLAIVAGVPKPETATIDAPVGRHLTNRTKMSVLQTASSRPAQTTYRTLDATEQTALLECNLHTGRTHQIRVHLRTIGYPILGDPTYSTSGSVDMSERYGIENLCLHSWKMSFTSLNGKDVDVKAPMHDMFARSLDACGLHLR